MGNIFYLLCTILLILLIIWIWWSDVVIESSLGFHNEYSIAILTYSMILFILSEIFFFVRFFWTFFHLISSPDIFIGRIWPYKGINRVSFYEIPLLNSILLLRRGCSITWRHYIILQSKKYNMIFRLKITIMLGIIFILCQIFEYKNSYFSFSDGSFGSIFYITTGFHGLHVRIGLVFLFISLMRSQKIQFSSNHFLGFEFSIWYWHFVDVVWLYLYLIVYWLGG